MDAVAAGFCADVNYRVAGAARLGEEQIFFFGDAQRERVDQRILRVTRLEANFSANGGHAERISVIGDAADHAVEDAAIFCDGFGGDGSSRLFGSDRAEAQRIEDGDGAGAHGENVAKDSADAGGGALKGLQRNWDGCAIRF